MTQENDLLNPTPIEEPNTLDLSEVEDKMEDKMPDMSDPTWTDYVIRQLEPDELYDGNPTTDGLRRIVSKLLGPIVESLPIIAQSPNPGNDNRAVIGWTIAIRWDGVPTDIRRFGDVADVYGGNTTNEYAIYASATAATRAEGRALRKALQLRHVVTSDEVGDVAPKDPNQITDAQKVFVAQICGRNGVSMSKLLQYGKEKYQSLDDVPYVTAVKMIQWLNKCQNGKEKFPVEIMENKE